MDARGVVFLGSARNLRKTRRFSCVECGPRSLNEEGKGSATVEPPVSASLYDTSVSWLD